uniref:Uncharacterized protein n=1 Tax=Vitis vinifera TaxID=29760 RepID=F6I2P3_VITVI
MEEENEKFEIHLHKDVIKREIEIERYEEFVTI